MKRELVKCLRTVAFLAMFSQDPDTVANIKGCLQSMSYMEPDLILHSILERAVPSLEALVEVCTHTAMFVLKVLNSEIDTANDCCDKSFGCCCPCYRVPGRVLPWSKTSGADSTAPHSGD